MYIFSYFLTSSRINTVLYLISATLVRQDFGEPVDRDVQNLMKIRIVLSLLTSASSAVHPPHSQLCCFAMFLQRTNQKLALEPFAFRQSAITVSPRCLEGKVESDDIPNAVLSSL